MFCFLPSNSLDNLRAYWDRTDFLQQVDYHTLVLTLSTEVRIFLPSRGDLVVNHDSEPSGPLCVEVSGLQTPAEVRIPATPTSST